ncbi:MAG: HAD hydrolase family protein [Candidatus Aenigmarchaeota archaeon]|nr:HAD hydrolase family protein [Candidatus Aenigmarchaeota archaeon]
MLNKDIPKKLLNKIKLLVLDTDGVTIERGTKIIEKDSEEYWTATIRTNKISRELADMIKKLEERGLLVMISSGRSLVYLQSMYSRILGDGTILQAENGNLSMIGGKIIQHFNYSQKYFEKISRIKERIKKLPISGFEPKQFILTVHSPKEFKDVYKIVKEEDPKRELTVMWNGEAFDIQKREVNKGEGLKKIVDYLKIDGLVIAIGDRVNDKELLDVADIGISADESRLKEEYWTIDKELPGEQLIEYLINNLVSKNS